MTTPLVERLTLLMGEKSARQWASDLGVNHRTLLNYLSGREPSAGFIVCVCEHMLVSADWLLLGRGTIKATEPSGFRSRCASLADHYDLGTPKLRTWMEAALDDAFPPSMLAGGADGQ